MNPEPRIPLRFRLLLWLRRQVLRLTWPWLVSRTGLAGLVYMVFNPDSATPALVVAFAAMVGLKPMTDFDKFFKSGGDEKSDKKRGKRDD